MITKAHVRAWYDLKKERKVLSRLSLGGGGMMVWVAFKKCAKN